MDVVGIDTGGTFCDLVQIDADGRASVHKSPSTPSDTAIGVFNVLEVARSQRAVIPSAFYREIGSIALGTTIATNTVVTRSGAKVGLLTTRGHGDMLPIMRVNGRVVGRPLSEIQNYSVTDKPAPIIPKPLIIELDERIDYTGEVIVPLDESQVIVAVDTLVKLGVQSIAVSLLWGFLNPVHESKIEDLIRSRHHGVFVSRGSTLSRRLGEYERTEAAVVNGYVALAVQEYLDKVTAGLKHQGLSTHLLVMHSAGGVGSESHARNLPITTLFSGPAGGIVASKRVCEAAGFANVICADVGGTTFDVGLVVKGRPLLKSTSIIDQRVMYCSTIDIVSIGAGGGSIARVDPATRRLTVGPQSAGASPGPACYRKGGEYPTVTDANLILGYMDAERFLGGRFRLDREAAVAMLSKHVAEPLGVSVEQAAIGIFSIVNAKMADLVRKVTVERGHDPREFVLCAYGGLGPLHAPFYAKDLNVKAVLIPLGELSSVFSAYGIAMADLLHVREVSRTLREPFVRKDLDSIFEELAGEANRALERDGIRQVDRVMRRFVEARYVGQLNELILEVPENPSRPFDVRQTFEHQYIEAFGPGAAWKDAPVEIVGFRLEALGKRKKFPVAKLPKTGAPENRTAREVYWPQFSRFIATPIYDGHALGAEARLTGPAVIEFPTTTILVPPDWRCVTDLVGNIILNQENSEALQ